VFVRAIRAERCLLSLDGIVQNIPANKNVVKLKNSITIAFFRFVIKSMKYS